GSFEKAVEYLEAAKLVPEGLNRGKDDSLLSDYVLYYLGETYLAINKVDEALNAFTACINHNAKSPLAPSAMEKTGDIYLIKGGATNAINAYKRILTGYSDNLQTPRILYKLASLLLLNNKYDEALPFIKRLLTEFPQAEYNDNSFVSQVMPGEIRKLNRDEFAARARGLLKARNYEKAVKEIKTYLSETLPWFPYETPLGHDDKLNLIMGQTFYQARNYKKAGEVFKELFSTADDSKIRQESLIWLARNHIRQKDMKSAQNALKAFISVYTDRNLRDEAIYRLAMIAKEEGDVNLAVAFLEQLIAESPSSSYKDDALWQAGWIRYTQGDLEKSLEIFKKIETAHKSLENSSLRMRALYWQGKISLMLGKKDNAVRLFKTAADSFPGAYYSVMSKKELERISGYELLDVSFKVSNPQLTILNTQSDEPLPAQRARRLLKLGLNSLALKELASMDYRQDPINIILLYKQAGDIYHSYILARRLSYDLPDFSYRLAYPEAYKDMVERAAGEFSLDPLLIYAVMMQESEFDAKSVSSAGAIGLLQIMPGTGEMIAKKMSYQPPLSPPLIKGGQGGLRDNLFEPDININFGSWYLKTLITRFNGKLPLAIAAYNAGPNAVDEWLKKWGESDMDEFVENIPYQETRKYVEKVLGYYAAYKTIYVNDSEANLDSRIAENSE
ncbi:MAG: tetratricopeptide repeat protein, partial [Deltaproteobacteria bacterium]|nr:tetratricopeptide repeat protein [Deltaproteobacteria bacterium]